MSLSTAVSRFRAKQAEQFTQEATIRRPTGEPYFDTALEQTVQAMTTIGTARPCKVTANDRAGMDVEAAQTLIRVTDLSIKFGVGEDVQRGDVVTITASEFNSTDVDRSYRVTDVDRREWQISRRVVVEETLAPPLNEDGS